MNENIKEKIYKRFKQEIAISNFENEITNQYSYKKEGKNMKKFKISNMVAILFVVAIIGFVTPTIYAKIQWNIQFKEYLYRPTEQTKGSLDEARESDYAEVLNMDYLTQDGVSIKVNSILITDDCLDANITFKFADDKKVNAETFEFGYAIYDENNNIYITSRRVHTNSDRTLFLYEELGVKYNKYNINAIQLSQSSSVNLVEVNEQEKSITKNITIRARDTFPKSRKIYIRIFDLGYYMFDETDYIEEFDILNAEWIFEIDVPEKFYERQTLELKLQDEIPGLEIQKVTLSEVSLVLNFKSQEYSNLTEKAKNWSAAEYAEVRKNMLNITDSEGKMYEEIQSSTNPNDCKVTFDVAKKELDKKLFINFTINGQKYTSELVEK